MLIGKIDYINLLPFHLFLKRYIKSSALKQAIESSKSYPSKINRDFKRGRINGAFISSIESKKAKSIDLGIVADGKVLSVLAFEGEFKEDFHSKTSNALAKILEINGEIVIGDKALKRYLAKESCIDLSLEWKKRYNLPFVFGLFCYNKNPKYFKKLAKAFRKYLKKSKNRAFIPTYILNDYSKKTGIAKKDILFYLEHIYYVLEYKERLSLKKFLNYCHKNRL